MTWRATDEQAIDGEHDGVMSWSWYEAG